MTNNWLMIILLTFLVVCAVTVSFSKSLINSILVYMGYSLVMSIIWILLESPDLAITEAAVGAGVDTVLFFIALRKIKSWQGQEVLQETTTAYATKSLLKRDRFVQRLLLLVFCVIILSSLVLMVSYLPPVGDPTNPANNEVAARYIEKGLEETGSVNFVTGLILQYRGFDTFGETHVLFIATCCVMILLMLQEEKLEHISLEDQMEYEPHHDAILQTASKVLVPVILLFGIYIMLNGHLSPGGGFSGGAVFGAGLILYVNSYGIKKTQKFFNEHIYRIVKVGALGIYALLMSYYFITGGNGLASIVPLGHAGDILSAGLILPINLLVGLEVSCTMYAFYALFRRGGL